MVEKFKPEKDGWFFKNWGEDYEHCVGCALPAGHAGNCEFTWDLFRETFLGINPTHDCVEAPLDCGFYEIYKGCANQGNCGGMSLLALAVYKYGGFMGFCSPASFYTGDVSPDSVDLHKAINILQGRQFSSKGIMNFVEVFNSNTINDAYVAFQKVKECLSNGDFAVLSIANSTFGESAHTVIPYNYEENPAGFPSGTKVLHIWDSNHPYDADPTYYSGVSKLLVINGRYDWNYANYSGSNNGWCFAIPMSLVLTKSRQPMALDIAAQALITLFVTGPGAAVSQISDEEGRRFYKTTVDSHKSRLELETDPNKRIKGLARWPWYGFKKGQKLPGELYFMLRHPGNRSPTITTVSGAGYKMIQCIGKNLIEVNTVSREHARETFKTSGFISGPLSIEIMSTGKKREISLDHVLLGTKKGEWRRYRLTEIRLPEKVKMNINITNQMNALMISTEDDRAHFKLDFQQRSAGKVTAKKASQMSTTPDKVLRVAPQKWKTLAESELEKEILDRE